MSVKAIETRYKGYRFRSRLEARWAVFFDALDVRWEYEPEGFELGGGERYLPDFFVHVAPCWRTARMGARPGYWVEVKGGEPTLAELGKLERVCVGTGHHGYTVWGAPGEHIARIGASPSQGLWALSFSAFVSMCTADYSEARVGAAVSAARGARFEFGESGARV